jgi:predicted transcriptional regulator
MVIQGAEWLLLFTLFAVILVVIWRRRKEKVLESIVLALVRNKNGTTIDEIIIGAHISADEAIKVLRKLIAKGVIKTEDRDGKTIYKVT